MDSASSSTSSTKATLVLAPGLVDINEQINYYGTRIGAKIYRKGSSSLQIKIDEDNISTLTDALISRALEMGRHNVKASRITLTVICDGLTTCMNLIEDFGRHTIQELRDYVLMYYNLPTRQT